MQVANLQICSLQQAKSCILSLKIAQGAWPLELEKSKWIQYGLDDGLGFLIQGSGP